MTSDNYRDYIHQLAHYKLNRETAEQNRAFLAGFREIIPLDLIRIFSSQVNLLILPLKNAKNYQEVQLLIGGEQRPIDVEELRRFTKYGGGYHESQPYIQVFMAYTAIFE